MPKRFLPFFPLLILSAFLLSACGGGGGSSDSAGTTAGGPEAEIEAAMVESATSTDPSVCTEFDTPGFAEQAAHQEGSGAVNACEAEAPNSDGKAKSVAVADVQVDGSKATLEATLEGSLFDGQEVEAAMVEEGGGWKVDKITRIVALDPGKLRQAFEAVLGASGELTDAQVSCIGGKVGDAKQAVVEEVLLSSSPQPFIDIASSCA